MPHQFIHRGQFKFACFTSLSIAVSKIFKFACVTSSSIAVRNRAQRFNYIFKINLFHCLECKNNSD